MGASDDERDVIYVERDEDRGSDRSSPLWWLLLGGLVGAGVALLLAPRTGAETRQELGTRARRLQDYGRRKLAEFTDEEDDDGFGGGGAASGAWEDDEEDEGEDWEGEYDAYVPEEEDEDTLEDAAEEGGQPAPAKVTAARRELERRLARARARREAQEAFDAEEDEEPVA